MIDCNENIKFKRSIICSSIVLGVFMLYCISEMIVSWCVDYCYYYLDGRIVSTVISFVLTIIFATQYKKIDILPALVCGVIFFALMLDFFIDNTVGIFSVNSVYNAKLKIFPLVMWFEMERNMSHPQNSHATDLGRRSFYTCTVIFVIVLLVALIILIVSLEVKKSKLDIIKANKILNGATIGLTVFLFVEFMRNLFALLAR